MAKNIFEELVAEIETIIGGRFKIEIETEGLNIYFEKTDKEEIRKALQETVSFIMRNSHLKRFSFEEQEINNIHLLASVFLKLTGAGLNSFHTAENQFAFAEHFLECGGCQMNLLKILEHFITGLFLLRKKERKPFLGFFKNLFRKIFGPKKRNERTGHLIGLDAVLPTYLSLSSLLWGSKLLLNSEKKREIFQKYIPSFIEKSIEPEKILGALARSVKEKNGDLTIKEFEKILQKLAR
ncbi:MAG: hypothetical protein AAB514_00930 [Patescibacteria group bacterium]